MDEIQSRLQESAKKCLEAYEGWQDKKQDSKSQESLGSAIHELRKVASRLEIELAISERDQITSKPLPIPAHRANNKKGNSGALDKPDSGAPRKRRGPRKPEARKEASGE